MEPRPTCFLEGFKLGEHRLNVFGRNHDERLVGKARKVDREVTGEQAARSEVPRFAVEGCGRPDRGPVRLCLQRGGTFAVVGGDRRWTGSPVSRAGIDLALPQGGFRLILSSGFEPEP
jgi:hypothetical protein